MIQLNLLLHVVRTVVTKSFTYLSGIVHNNSRSSQVIPQWIGLDHGVMNSLMTSIWHCQNLCWQTDSNSKITHAPCLIVWTLNTDLKSSLDTSYKK